jgi:hypothetical protein
MVHNGTIEEADYLKNKYETVSETDSECLLRIFEHGIEKDFTIDSVPEDIAKKIGGIKDIWSYISSGAMAVALGERVDDYNKNLFLFRNEKRPLWLADLRDMLGQIFFFSSPDIWYSAIGNNQNLKKQCWSTSKLIEIPSHEIWCLNIDYNSPTAVEDRIYRFKVEAKPTGIEFSKGDFKSIKPSQIKLSVITDLDENEKILECDENKIQEKITPEVNHDDRLWRALRDGSDGPLRHLAGQLIDRIGVTLGNVPQYPYCKRRGVMRWGDHAFIHGFHGGLGAAKQAALVYGSVIQGHTHSIDHYSIPGLEPRIGRCCGCLCKLDMDYTRGNMGTLAHSNGWVYGVRIGDRLTVWHAEKIGDVWVYPTEVGGG